MPTLLSRIFSPTFLLYSFVVVTQLEYGAYLGAQLDFPEVFRLFYAIGILWSFGWWLQTDSKKRSVDLAYDRGLFLYIAWPILLSYYLIKTRGPKGLLIILAFIAVYIGSTAIGIILSAIAIAMRP